jgi:SAM-dependent methyltransferase
LTNLTWHPSEVYRGYPTIRMDWERFYKEFADRYHRFALATDAVVAEMHGLFGFGGTRVLDLTSGTGRSTFAIAKHAAHAVGVEPWAEMRNEALRLQRALGVTNVEFLAGGTEALPPARRAASIARSASSACASSGNGASRTKLRALRSLAGRRRDARRAARQPGRRADDAARVAALVRAAAGRSTAPDDARAMFEPVGDETARQARRSRQSQPFCCARRAASTRLRAPSF